MFGLRVRTTGGRSSRASARHVLEIEELEPRCVLATTGISPSLALEGQLTAQAAMQAALPSQPSTVSATPATVQAALVLTQSNSGPQNPIATLLPIAPPQAVSAAFAPPPVTTAEALLEQGASPATLLAQLGWVGLAQVGPRAQFALSVLLSGGDEFPVGSPQEKVAVEESTRFLAAEATASSDQSAHARTAPSPETARANELIEVVPMPATESPAGTNSLDLP